MAELKEEKTMTETTEMKKNETVAAGKQMTGMGRSMRPERNGRRNGGGHERREREVSEFEERVVQVSRVSKKTKGGNQMGFSIVAVVGDKKGRVGVGLGKGKDVAGTIKKATKRAKSNLITVPMDGTTIPFAVSTKLGSARIILMPAPKGSGIIAGGVIRSVVEVAGIRDMSSKVMGTTNQASNAYATFAALKEIDRLVKIKGLKLRSIADIETEEAAKLAAIQAEAKQKGEQKIKAEGARKNVVAGGAKKVVSAAAGKGKNTITKPENKKVNTKTK